MPGLVTEKVRLFTSYTVCDEAIPVVVQAYSCELMITFGPLTLNPPELCFDWPIMHAPMQGRIQDFRFSGVEGIKWRAKRAAILATPIFAPEKRSFPPFSGLYTPYTEYKEVLKELQ